jgi:hypothetical protein
MPRRGHHPLLGGAEAEGFGVGVGHEEPIPALFEFEYEDEEEDDVPRSRSDISTEQPAMECLNDHTEKRREVL